MYVYIYIYILCIYMSSSLRENLAWDFSSPMAKACEGSEKTWPGTSPGFSRACMSSLSVRAEAFTCLSEVRSASGFAHMP